MRINLLGGPCAGKSTTAARVFAQLKQRQVSVELVTEYVKAWACQKRQINSFDQVYLLGKQMQYEFRFLSSGTKNIITDSPVFLSGIYAGIYYPDLSIAKPIMDLVDAYEKQHPSFNLFLYRGDKPYLQEGRYQTYEQAKQVDDLIYEALITKVKDGWNVQAADYDDEEGILNAVLKNIEK